MTPAIRLLGATPGITPCRAQVTEERLLLLAYLAWHLNEDVPKEDLVEAIMSVGRIRQRGGVPAWLAQDGDLLESWVSRLRTELGSQDGDPGTFTLPHSKRNSGVYRMTGPRNDVDVLSLFDASAAAFEHYSNQQTQDGMTVAKAALDMWRGPLKTDVFNTAAFAQLDKATRQAYQALLATYARCSVPQGRAKDAHQLLLERISVDPWLEDDPDFQIAFDEVASKPTQRRGLPSSGGHLTTLPQSVYTNLEAYLGEPALRRSQQVLDEILADLPSDPAFRFFTISGISAAGKDSLVRRVRAIGDSENAAQFTIMTKLTTRERRPYEEEYSIAVSPEEFIKSLASGDIIFPYQKRGSLYGFRADDLRVCMTNGRKLLAVFTQFELVPQVHRAFCAHGLAMVPVFIRVNSNSAMQRTEGRNFSLQEQMARRESITQDLESIAARGTKFDEEYLFINHTNDNDQNSAVDQLLKVIRGSHPEVERFVVDPSKDKDERD